jgi:transmembrane sensor
MNKAADDLPDDLFEEACRWQARLRDPNSSGWERAAFAEWLRRDPRNETAYAQAERLWSALAVPASMLAKHDQSLPSRGRSFHASRRFFFQAAASLALTASAGFWASRGGFDDLRSDYRADVGERRSVSLADGSGIMLNTDTAMAVDFSRDSRRVRLFRGEAYFSVAPDAARPFVVETPVGTVRVTGTAFNLRLDGDSAMLSVIEGRVAAQSIGRSGVLAAESISVRAGRQAVIGPSAVGPATGFDATAVTAWQRGQVVFYRTPLGRVVKELNRYQRGWIGVAGDGLRDLRVTGVFDIAHPAAVIDVIQRTLGVKTVRLTDRMILLY